MAVLLTLLNRQGTFTGSGTSYSAALKFNDARNSQYFFLLFGW